MPISKNIDDEEDGIDDSNDETQEQTEKGDKKKLLPASHYIGEKYLWEMTEKSEPTFSKVKNNQIFTVPTTRIEIEDKLGPDQQPRFLEDEGMYIGEVMPPVMKNKNQHKLEHRILKEMSIRGQQTTQWFGTDGRLVALPNPLRKKPTRPDNLDEESCFNEPLTYFCNPTLPGTVGPNR